jgi:hypothetical protein
MKLRKKNNAALKNAAVSKNDILRYVYHETSAKENGFIQSAILASPELEQYFYELLDAKSCAEKSVRAPRQRVVDNIMKHARRYSEGEAVKG